jgi:hypothetical protein
MKIKTVFFTFATVCFLAIAFPPIVTRCAVSVMRSVNHGATVSLQSLRVLAQAWRLDDVNWNPQWVLAVPCGVLSLSDLVTLTLRCGSASGAGVGRGEG